MNKIKILALALIATAITFSSCKKDEETPDGPTLTVTSSESSVWYGDSIVFNYNITSNEKLELFTASSNLLGDTDQEIDDFGGDHSTSGTVTFHIPTTGLSDGGSIVYSFYAEDKDGATYGDSKTITVSTSAPVTDTPMTDAQTGVINNLIGASQGAWDLVANAGVSSSGDAADKDIANTTTTGSTAPETFETEWEALNATMFVMDAGFDYANATVEAATAAFAAGTATATVSGVANGDVYVAKLRGGDDYAVIRITNVDVTTDNNDDKIEFEYKK